MPSQSDQMLYENNLQYRLPESLSLAVNRTHKKQYFLRRTYDDLSGVAQCTWNTGVDYVNLENSYLYIKFKATGANSAFGNGGSIMNIFRNSKISHRSRTEISRTERLNLYMRNKALYSETSEWLANQGLAMGHGVSLVNATEQSFCVPMRYVDPAFCPLNESQIMPASLASGLHVEFDFEAFTTAIFGVGVTSYEVTDIYFNLDCVTLQDSANYELNKEASSNLLEWSFNRVFTSPEPLLSTSINTTINKAVSSANRCFAIVIDSADKVVANDSMKSEAYLATKFQYRLGSEYYPNSPIENAQEAYFIALAAYNNHTKSAKTIAVTTTEFAATHGIHAVSLERDQSLDRSSLPINTSRMLELQATFSAVPAASQGEIILFLEYLSIVRVSLQNVSVKI